MNAESKSDDYRPQTAADHLARRLRARLFDGSFAPGEIVSIRRIAEAEGVSVIPARDALRGLVAEGALVFRDSRTIVVPRLDPATLGEMRLARLAIETELATRAAPRLMTRSGDLAAIDAEVNAAIAARDVPGYMQANHRLHFTIYEAAGAPLLLQLAETLWLRFAPSMRIVCAGFEGRVPSADFHRAAIAALEAGDAAAFTAALKADIAQGMDVLLAHAGTGKTRGSS